MSKAAVLWTRPEHTVIQDDFGSLFVKKIEGDYYNVVGFPINAFYQKLKLNFRELFTQIYFS